MHYKTETQIDVIKYQYLHEAVNLSFNSKNEKQKVEQHYECQFLYLIAKLHCILL